MQKLLMLGILAGLGFGFMKFVKKNKASASDTNSNDMQPQAN